MMVLRQLSNPRTLPKSLIDLINIRMGMIKLMLVTEELDMMTDRIPLEKSIET